MPHDEYEAVITLRDLHEDIRAIRNDLTTVIAQLSATTTTQADHEMRIRELEKTTASSVEVAKHEERLDALDRKHWYATGALVVLGILFPNLGEIAKLFGG
ncbi:hypothetical protein HUO13_12035 [Saccharopolyspora erythraea]|uniref:hypothetical protein n=1 Tax=Saccharopolyspora erythraea TaxID=1836 RepID=UPI001BA56377|nr:hypothetical protein [Saccharopolyspora erythraea]QUH01442.1 hypothetical protein HUO13_12035 [Saccharopolyspora erythraea]